MTRTPFPEFDLSLDALRALQLEEYVVLTSNWVQRHQRLAEQLDSVVMCKCVDSHFSVTAE